MAYPKRRNEIEEPSSERSEPLQGPVLVQDDIALETLPGPSLQPPRRVPPVVAGTGTGPEPSPFPSEIRYYPVEPSSSSPAYFTFHAGAVIVIVVVLFAVLLAGILGSLGT